MKQLIGGIAGALITGIAIFGWNGSTARGRRLVERGGDAAAPAAGLGSARHARSRDGQRIRAPALNVTCEPGQRAVIRRMPSVAGMSMEAGCVGGDDIATLSNVRGLRARAADRSAPVPCPWRTRRLACSRRGPCVTTTMCRHGAVEPRRSWKKRALVIGGSAGAGAGVGAHRRRQEGRAHRRRDRRRRRDALRDRQALTSAAGGRAAGGGGQRMLCACCPPPDRCRERCLSSRHDPVDPQPDRRQRREHGGAAADVPRQPDRAQARARARRRRATSRSRCPPQRRRSGRAASAIDAASPPAHRVSERRHHRQRAQARHGKHRPEDAGHVRVIAGAVAAAPARDAGASACAAGCRACACGHRAAG